MADRICFMKTDTVFLVLLVTEGYWGVPKSSSDQTNVWSGSDLVGGGRRGGIASDLFSRESRQ